MSLHTLVIFASAVAFGDQASTFVRIVNFKKNTTQTINSLLSVLSLPIISHNYALWL